MEPTETMAIADEARMILHLQATNERKYPQRQGGAFRTHQASEAYWHD